MCYNTSHSVCILPAPNHRARMQHQLSNATGKDFQEGAFKAARKVLKLREHLKSNCLWLLYTREIKASLGTCVLRSCTCVLIPGHSRNRYFLFPCRMMEPQRQNWSGPRTLTAKSWGGVACHPTASSANPHIQGVASWPVSLHSGQRT